MRIVIIAIACAMTGASVGIGINLYDAANTQERFTGSLGIEADENLDLSAGVDPSIYMTSGVEFDFGELNFNASGIHNFTVKNNGLTPLTLEYLEESCGRCIQTEFDAATIEPGESGEVPVEYMIKKGDTHFQEYLELATNDPDRPVLRLTIKGIVQKQLRSSEPQLVLTDLSATRSLSHTFQVYDFARKEIGKFEVEWMNQRTAKYFDVEISPLDLAEVDYEPTPKSAAQLKVVVSPGLPLGDLNQTLLLTNEANEPLEIPIHGQVKGDFSVIGKRFTSERMRLSLGKVQRDKGARETLRLLVRGPERETLEFSIASVDPEGLLQANLGERQSINDGAVVVYPLHIEIPAGAPVVNRLGSVQGKPGRIRLKTSHEYTKELVIYVTFATE